MYSYVKKKKHILFAILLIIIILLNTDFLTTHVRNIETPREPIFSTEPPIILLHGFNPAFSARLGEIQFKEMQIRLVQDLQYEDKLSYVKGTECHTIQGEKIIIRVSYFDDVERFTIEEHTKEFSQILDHIKNCTQSEKVIIITHSMGGIVARDYIRTIDNTSIEKLIMLGTPNKGGLYNYGKIATKFNTKINYELTIDFIQLSEENEFMQELNEHTLENIEYYTIAGNIDGKGDSLVLEESVKLEGSNGHFTVNCAHSFLISPLVCPDAYEHVLEKLR